MENLNYNPCKVKFSSSGSSSLSLSLYIYIRRGACSVFTPIQRIAYKLGFVVVFSSALPQFVLPPSARCGRGGWCAMELGLLEGRGGKTG